MSKKLEQKQQRRLAEERKRSEMRRAALRRNAVTIGVGVIVFGAVLVLIIQQRQEQGGAAANVGVPAAQAGCTEVETLADQGAEHIEEGAAHEPYNSDPPTSGPHFAIPAEAGFYPDQLPPEQVVHNMEHGQIVIWYRPDLEQSEIDEIAEIVDQEALATVALPYSNIQPPASYALTAWRNSQTCEEISSEAVNNFRRRFQGEGPEDLTPPFAG